MDAEITRKIKIYCPQHQTVSEVEEKPQVICEIREHALSNDFPRAEYWEYCCDCRIFSPSSFGSGGKARANCPHCESPIARRFLCDECKTVSYESDEDTKGKNFGIGAEGVKPACPGCRKIFGTIHSNQHQCAEIEGLLTTHRAECPFCEKSTFAKASEPKPVEPLPDNVPPPNVAGKPGSTQCPKCGNWGFAGRIHCGKCGTRLAELDAGVSPGTASPRTQLLGSICPNCGTGNQAGSYFCNSCGQALKIQPAAAPAETAAKTVNLPPPIPNTQKTVPPGAQTFPPNSFPPNYNPPQPAPFGQNKPLLYVGGVALILVFILGLIAYNAKKSDGNTARTSTPTPSPSPVRTSTPLPRNAAPVDMNYTANTTTTNTSSSSPLVGRTGRLTRNLNIRSSSSKDSVSWGVHYEGARVEILEIDSYTSDGEFVTWYRVKVLENGCDRATNRCGNNWENDYDFGWLKAEMEGWMNAKYIALK